MLKNNLTEFDFQIEQYTTTQFNLNTYFIISEEESALVDPIFHPTLYDDLLKQTQTTLKYILITHHPHEFVNDEEDLSKRTGATIIYGEKANNKYSTKSKTQLQLGSVKIEVLSTPGYTEDSTCFVLIDSKNKQKAIFTGATLNSNDIGHTYIESNTTEATKRKIANEMSESLALISQVDPSCIIFPGYNVVNPSSNTKMTIDSVMQNNEYMKATNEDKITKIMQTFQPYKTIFKTVAKATVKQGMTRQQILKGVRKLLPGDVQAYIDQDKDNNYYIFDTRDQTESTIGFIPTSIILSLKIAYTTYMLGTIDLNANIIFVTQPRYEMDSIIPAMQAGYTNIVGYLDGGFDAWKNAKKPIERVVYEPSTKDHVEELVKLNSFIIDIREVNEFKDVGIVGGSVLAPLSNFNKHEKDGVVDKTKNVYVLCKSGGRACIAYTYLKKLKYTNKMIVLQGGCNKLQETGFVFTPYDG